MRCDGSDNWIQTQYRDPSNPTSVGPGQRFPPLPTRGMLELTSSSADEVRETMEGTVDISHPSAENLFCAFLAMESTDWLLQLARESGGGSITVGVQSFILEHCIKNIIVERYPLRELYVKRFLKKIIVAVESSCLEVLDGLYGQLMLYMSSFKEDNYFESKTKVCKCISFIFPDGFHKSSLTMRSGKLLVPLKCSLNMLEGDTGCCIWPSSFFLSEFILSYPEVFSNKCCFEVGSGVGLVGICLVHAKASRVILSDGDLLALSNMRLNLEMNHPDVLSEVEGQMEKVKCLFLPWESASESELQGFDAEIIVGADVIYDPLCVPHLIRVLAMLLKPKRCSSHQQAPSLCEELDGVDILQNSDHTDQFHQEEITCSDGNDLFNETGSFCFSRLNATPGCGENKNQSSCFELKPSNRSQLDETVDHEISRNGGNMDYGRNHSSKRKRPVAYIATVIRNKETFEHFLSQAEYARLSVVDITELQPPLRFLPYMHSYDRSCVRLLKLCYSGS